MLKKFAEGLAFGAGFAISFAVIAFIGTSIMFSMAPTTHWSVPPASLTTTQEVDEGDDTPFHEIPIEERIKRSSVIALAKYEPAEDGRMKAILKEFLKKDEGVRLHYDIGEEYTPASYYPKKGTSYGDGLVIFFEGSPATMRMSMTYSGDRIHSLGDMPMELLRDKCSRGDA
jgi:hypothetical protein